MKPRFAVISYLPFFRGKTPEDAAEYMNVLPHEIGSASGCIWTMEEKTGEITAILILNLAEGLHEHLLEWSEGHVEARWRFGTHDFPDGRYGFLLAPNIEQSILRAKINISLQTGQVIPDDHTSEVVFRPFSFISLSTSPVYNQIKDKIGNNLKIYFLDQADFDDHGFRIEDLFLIGIIERTDMFTGYLEGLIEP
jgi:hypothetical protein